MTPDLLLALCFTVGSGMALFGPAWQASVSEQVPSEALPSAVALNSISYNIARSFGPAIGGVIVAAAGAIAAFATNALAYLPLVFVLFLWRRAKEPSRLPPERLARAVISGVRYIWNSPSIRVLLVRTLVTGIVGGSVAALMPIATRDLLRGGAQTYGVMLGAFGLGGGDRSSQRIYAAFALWRGGRDPPLRRHHGHRGRNCRSESLTDPYGRRFIFAGAGWTASVTLFNVGIQLAAPRWVAGRALAAYQAAIAGGIAIGSWIWGTAAGLVGVKGALLASGAALILSSLLGF
jgi:Transmembrane secretion effector